MAWLVVDIILLVVGLHVMKQGVKKETVEPKPSQTS